MFREYGLISFAPKKKRRGKKNLDAIRKVGLDVSKR